MAHDGDISGYYGPGVVGATRAAQVPYMKTDAFGGGTAVVSRLRTKGSKDTPARLPQEEAFVLTLALEPFQREMTIFDGDRLRTNTIETGHFSFCDLSDNLGLELLSSCNALQFYMSHESLEATAAELSVKSLDTHLRSGDVAEDQILAKILGSFCPAFEAPDQVNQLFVDHLTRAMAAHVTHYYFGAARLSFDKESGLSTWQERRIREILDESLSGSISLQALADECAVSVRHFSRAFNHSFGMPPYRWILARRVERAKSLLGRPNLRMDEVAWQCGFTNQSHLTRVFKQIVGISPADWRKSHGA